jgi:hypothetical protein
MCVCVLPSSTGVFICCYLLEYLQQINSGSAKTKKLKFLVRNAPEAKEFPVKFEVKTTRSALKAAGKKIIC